RQIRHMATMVDDLLEMFRLHHRKISLAREPLDLAKFVQDSAEDHRSSLERAGVQLELELPVAPVWVEVDRTRLVQVLTNLLQNAGKFTNPGDRVTVKVEVDCYSNRAAVMVRDTGVGMTPEVQAEVFEMFSQG